MKQAKRSTMTEEHKRAAQRPLREKTKTAAHEMGHVIAHVVTSTYFNDVWIAGVNEWQDKWRHDDLKTMAGCVRSFQHGEMTFDGSRVKCKERDADAEDMLLILLAGIAGQEVFAGIEKPRSIIEVSRDYRSREIHDGTASGDFRQAQKWVKHGVENGYFHAKEIWGVLQHYYNQSFHAVRSHKVFLDTAVALLTKTGVMYNTGVMTLWNSFYQIQTTKKDAKTRVLDIKDNADAQAYAQEEEASMQLTPLETFVLHDLSTQKVHGEIKDEQLGAYYCNRGVGGYNRFAYVEGRRYDIRGLIKKCSNILYLLQRMGLIKLDTHQNIVATLPAGILPSMASVETWNKDLTTMLDSFEKTVSGVSGDSMTVLNTRDIEHVIKGAPIKNTTVVSAFEAIAKTVQNINALSREEVSVRRATDIMGRDVASIKDDFQLRQRFVLELSAPALKAAVSRVKKDCVKPAQWDKMKTKERQSCSWNEWTAKYVNELDVKALIEDTDKLLQFAHHLKAESAHAAWRIEAARRHPDQGGSPEAAAAFNTVWDRVEKRFPKAVEAEGAAGIRG
jgi:hypothetical protein